MSQEGMCAAHGVLSSLLNPGCFSPAVNSEDLKQEFATVLEDILENEFEEGAAVSVDREGISLAGGSQRRALQQSDSVVVPLTIRVAGTTSPEEAADAAAQALGAEVLDVNLQGRLPSGLQVVEVSVSYAAKKDDGKQGGAGWMCTPSLGHLLAAALAIAYASWLA